MNYIAAANGRQDNEQHGNVLILNKSNTAMHESRLALINSIISIDNASCRTNVTQNKHNNKTDIISKMLVCRQSSFARIQL